MAFSYNFYEKKIQILARIRIRFLTIGQSIRIQINANGLTLYICSGEVHVNKTLASVNRLDGTFAQTRPSSCDIQMDKGGQGGGWSPDGRGGGVKG